MVFTTVQEVQSSMIAYTTAYHLPALLYLFKNLNSCPRPILTHGAQVKDFTYAHKNFLSHTHAATCATNLLYNLTCGAIQIKTTHVAIVFCE